jgi:hypothetical protein
VKKVALWVASKER